MKLTSIMETPKTKKNTFFTKLLLFLGISLFLELFLFNAPAYLSRLNLLTERFTHQPDITYEIGEGLTMDANGAYYITDGSNAYLELLPMDGALDYLYLGIDCRMPNGTQVPVNARIVVTDEGNSAAYELPLVTSYPPLEKSRYVQLHCYGAPQTLKIYLSADDEATLTIDNIIYNAKVPCFFSVTRAGFIFLLLSLLWLLRPGSSLYRQQWKKQYRMLIVAIVLFLNIGAFGIMSRMNIAFVNPTWPHHQQYHQLAVAFTEGKASIPVGIEEALSSLSNPYDAELRFSSLHTDLGWDTAFFEGSFYVYFGIVPVLLFYLPYYVLFHAAFPTWLGIFITGSLLLCGAFYLLQKIIQRYFPDTPFMIYLLLSLILGNGMGTIPMMLKPDFYSLPILCAMCFTIWGLGLWMQGITLWLQDTPSEKRASVTTHLFAGSLCMALTAGCRPQFLVGSFLLLPLLYHAYQEKKQKECSGKSFYRCNIKYLLCALLPYVIVAAGLMYYNAIRFHSPFDFGANYNLTTNDMTRRGFCLERIPAGIYRYLFQFPKIGFTFPFVEHVPLSTDYMGITIEEFMFGGILFTHIILFALFFIKTVKKELCAKKLFAFSICSLLFGFVVVIADTEMAGLLNRYTADFLWLFLLPAILIILQLWESATELTRKRIVVFLLISLITICAFSFFAGIRVGDLKNNNVHRFYLLRDFFL